MVGSSRNINRDFDPVQLGSIELFCKAAEQQSFTLAASALGLTPAAVSRSVARLEARLQVKLFARTTRQIRLTEEGKAYYEQCTQALQQIREAELSLAGKQREPSGSLRISAPTTYAHYRLLPLMPRFFERYPKIKIELNISNRNVDFVEEGYDVAIRLGYLDDARLASGLVARKLEDVVRGTYASPSYLKRFGMPRTPEDLHQHRCLQFLLPSTGRPFPWYFEVNGETQEFAFAPSISVTDDVLGGMTLAKNGGGICQSFHYIVADDIAQGRLVEVLKEYNGQTRPYSLVYLPNRLMSATVRAFVDFVMAEIANSDART
nr:MULTISPECIES: LysR family transcriptional regulator [Undibacterium]